LARGVVFLCDGERGLYEFGRIVGRADGTPWRVCFKEKAILRNFTNDITCLLGF